MAAVTSKERGAGMPVGITKNPEIVTILWKKKTLKFGQKHHKTS